MYEDRAQCCKSSQHALLDDNTLQALGLVNLDSIGLA